MVPQNPNKEMSDCLTIDRLCNMDSLDFSLSNAGWFPMMINYYIVFRNMN